MPRTSGPAKPLSRAGSKTPAKPTAPKPLARASRGRTAVNQARAAAVTVTLDRKVAKASAQAVARAGLRNKVDAAVAKVVAVAKGKLKTVTKANRRPIKGEWPPNPTRVKAILDGLEALYPDVKCELDHQNAFQLLVATILSAQCTDERVNQVTPKLFATFPTPAAMAAAPTEVLEDIIRSTGFFRQKSLSIKNTSTALVEKFGGEVPQSMEQLLTLRGVARKTANVVLGTVYGIAEGVVVDTHVQRLALRLALTRELTAPKIEEELMQVIPRDHWIRFSHQLIWHGRRVCSARKPDCEHCPLAPHCPSAFRES
ncbi:MAG TPA: endonuclease III [Polyangia bacterium]